MTSEPDIERRVRRIEDEMSIRSLVGRYAIAIDDRDIDSVVASFAEDGELVRGEVHAVGHQALRTSYEEVRRVNRLSIHSHHHHLIDWEDDDHARGLVAGHSEVVTGQVSLQNAFRYHDRYVRTPTGWKLARREVVFMYVAPRQDPALTGDLERLRWPGRPPAVAEYPETLPTWTDEVAVR